MKIDERNKQFFVGCPEGTTHYSNGIFWKLHEDSLLSFSSKGNDWRGIGLPKECLVGDITFLNRYEEHYHLFYPN